MIEHLGNPKPIFKNEIQCILGVDPGGWTYCMARMASTGELRQSYWNPGRLQKAFFRKFSKFFSFYFGNSVCNCYK